MREQLVWSCASTRLPGRLCVSAGSAGRLTLVLDTSRALLILAARAAHAARCSVLALQLLLLVLKLFKLGSSLVILLRSFKILK